VTRKANVDLMKAEKKSGLDDVDKSRLKDYQEYEQEAKQNELGQPQY
jgi:hypothetical protein